MDILKILLSSALIFSALNANEVDTTRLGNESVEVIDYSQFEKIDSTEKDKPPLDLEIVSTDDLVDRISVTQFSDSLGIIPKNSDIKALGPQADSVALTGTLLNAKSGEGYSEISLSILPGTRQITTDEDGFFEIKLVRSDSITFIWKDSTINIEQYTFKVPDSLEYMNVLLKAGDDVQQKFVHPDSIDMLVTASRGALHERKKVSSFKVKREEMREVAGTIGDPMRVVANMPGVSVQSDMSVRAFVRGGKAEEMRVFWNDVPLLQPYHMFSIFSIFNMEHVDNVELFTGNLPIEMNNALSAALVTESRKSPKDSLIGFNELSFMRENIYIGGPIVKGLSADISFQYFHWDWFVKRVGDVAVNLQGTDQDQQNWGRAKKFFAIPTFTDVQIGLEYQINDRLNVSYRALLASDWYYQLDPVELVNEIGNEELRIDSVDTLVYVEVYNWVHTLNTHFQYTDNWIMKGMFAYQSQDWDMNFRGDGGNIYTKPHFDLERQTVHAKFTNIFTPNESHVLNFGIALDVWLQTYDAYLMRPVYEFIVNGNMDIAEMMGWEYPDGRVILEDEGVGGMTDIMERLRFDHKGSRTQQFYSAFISDKWIIDSGLRIDLGMRLEYEQNTGDFFPSPRAALFKRIDDENELTFSVGLYSQSDIPYYKLNKNRNLSSEKNVKAEFEWSHDFSKYYRFEWRTYGKYYFDQVISKTQTHELPSTREELAQTVRHIFNLASGKEITGVDDEVIENFILDVGLEESAIDAIINQEYSQLPTSVVNILEYSEVAYSNEGIGYAAGSELIFRYDPTKRWRGWISGEISTSKRKDTAEGRWYEYNQYRPWKISWNNYFNMPNDWEIALRYTFTAGRAYTPWDETMNYYNGNDIQDTVLVIGKQNSRRYAPYERLDICLAQNSTFWGLPSRTYFEVWNALNSPNFLLHDSKTKKPVSFDLNFPFPIIYFGWQLRW